MDLPEAGETRLSPTSGNSRKYRGRYLGTVPNQATIAVLGSAPKSITNQMELPETGETCLAHQVGPPVNIGAVTGDSAQQATFAVLGSAPKSISTSNGSPGTGETCIAHQVGPPEIIGAVTGDCAQQVTIAVLGSAPQYISPSNGTSREPGTTCNVQQVEPPVTKQGTSNWDSAHTRQHAVLGPAPKQATIHTHTAKPFLGTVPIQAKCSPRVCSPIQTTINTTGTGDGAQSSNLQSSGLPPKQAKQSRSLGRCPFKQNAVLGSAPQSKPQ